MASGGFRARAFSLTGMVLLLACSGSSSNGGATVSGGNSSNAGMGGSPETAQGGDAGVGGTAGTQSGGSATVVTGGTADSGGADTGGVNAGGAGAGTGGADTGGAGGCMPGELDCECDAAQSCSGDLVCEGDICRSGVTPPDTACLFKVYADHDYFFCDGAVDHATAVERCASVGMHLVHIDDAEENAFIDSVMTAEACCPESVDPNDSWTGLWIGANDIETEGVWVWEDDQTVFWMGNYDYVTMENGSAVDGRYSSWGPIQPNRAYDGDEDCVRTKGLVWHDTPCTPDLVANPDFVGLGYICEQPTQQ